jgi:hypothetical protein
MTSTVSPPGTDPATDGVLPEERSGVAPASKGRIRRIAEHEHILVVLLAGFALIFLLLFPPALLVNDSWLNLMAGREVIENGLPDVDELTVYGLGSTWTDQQWGAQVFLYGVYSLGGFALLSIMACVFVVGAFTLAAAASRSLGAGARAIWLLFLPVLISAALGWSIRAQMLTLPLYTGLLWLLATQARRPNNLVWISLPMLVLWGNLHGSAALGAMLVMLLGAYELVRTRGRTWLRSAGLVVLAPLAILVTPYGPVTTARYYHLLLVDPPFAGQVTEWRWPAPASNTYAFYVLMALAVPIVIWGRRRLTVFDMGVLALTLFGALTAIRGIPWFAFACMVFVPVAIGRGLESRKPGQPRRGLNLGISIGLAAANVVAAGALFLRTDAFFEDYWPTEPADAIAAELRPGDRVFVPDRFSDWLLWKIPELRGRIAYDVRFEVYDRDFFERLGDYNWEQGDWKSFADGYRIVVVDETNRSHTADFLEDPGTRVIYKSEELTVIARPVK